MEESNLVGKFSSSRFWGEMSNGWCSRFVTLCLKGLQVERFRSLNRKSRTLPRLLNGGCKKWQMEGRPIITTEPPIITPTSYRAKTADVSLRVLREEVLESIKRTDRVLVDVRTPQEYSGELFMLKPPEGSQRTGHIPGVAHVNYDLVLNDDGSFKSVEELQAIYEDKGITPDKEIIPYCAVGARSGHTWFVLKYLLGYPNVRNYDGLWHEWSQFPDMPVEK